MPTRIYPHQLSWLIDNPLRRIILSPQRLVDRLNLSETSRVLEVGPGSGYLSKEIAKRIPRGKLVLLDIQPQMLVKARQKLESMGFQNVHYVLADASGEISGLDELFDVALLVCVLGEIPNRRACLQSLHRLLHLDGLLVVHESFPDPDMLKLESLRSLILPEGFTFSRRWGYSWNYTAAFRRLGARE